MKKLIKILCCFLCVTVFCFSITAYADNNIIQIAQEDNLQALHIEDSENIELASATTTITSGTIFIYCYNN